MCVSLLLSLCNFELGLRAMTLHMRNACQCYVYTVSCDFHIPAYVDKKWQDEDNALV